MSAISYSVKGAAEATGLSDTVIRLAINSGDLAARYPNTKAIIEHHELERWVQSMPTEKPERAV